MPWEITGNSGTNPTTNFLGNTDAQPLVIQANGGNVGIGTNAPSAGLEINKGSTNDLALKLTSSGLGWGSGVIFANAAQNGKNYGIYSGFGQLHFADADAFTDRLVIDRTGNIGIGTNTPNLKLTVVGNIGSTETISSQSVQADNISARVNMNAGRLYATNIVVNQDITLENADCAEDFDISELEIVEPGTVMVIDSEGILCQSNQPYDKRVAGVISGAGSYKPGLILDKRESSNSRMPISLVGKVYCKVDANYAAIEVGDLLTTSSTPGYAMKASNPSKAFGAVIGKALRPLEAGQGLIPILIALQ
jgi:hypothetical protein